MAILTFFNLASFVDYITPFSRVTPGAVDFLWLNSRVLRGDSPGVPWRLWCLSLKVFPRAAVRHVGILLPGK